MLVSIRNQTSFQWNNFTSQLLTCPITSCPGTNGYSLIPHYTDLIFKTQEKERQRWRRRKWTKKKQKEKLKKKEIQRRKEEEEETKSKGGTKITSSSIIWTSLWQSPQWLTVTSTSYSYTYREQKMNNINLFKRKEGEFLKRNGCSWCKYDAHKYAL